MFIVIYHFKDEVLIYLKNIKTLKVYHKLFQLWKQSWNLPNSPRRYVVTFEVRTVEPWILFSIAVTPQLSRHICTYCYVCIDIITLNTIIMISMVLCGTAYPTTPITMIIIELCLTATQQLCLYWVALERVEWYIGNLLSSNFYGFLTCQEDRLW